MTQVQERLQTEILVEMFGFCFGTFLKGYIFDVVALQSGFGTWAGLKDGCSPEQMGNCHLGRNGGNGISCHRWENQ